MDKNRASLLSVTRSIVGYCNADVICAPEPDTLNDIRLESGDNVEITEGDDDVVTEVEGVPDGAFRWTRREARAPLLVIVHGGSPTPPILFLYRGAAFVPPLTY